MTWRCNRSGRRSTELGTTLLELLIVLAVVAIILAALASRWQGPSDALLLDRAAAAMIEEAAMARARALVSGTPVGFSPRAADEIAVDDCATDRAKAPSILFLPDGQAAGGPICIRRNGRALRLDLDWLTGQMRRME